jgi:hypothetical protein
MPGVQRRRWLAALRQNASRWKPFQTMPIIKDKHTTPSMRKIQRKLDEEDARGWGLFSQWKVAPHPLCVWDTWLIQAGCLI